MIRLKEKRIPVRMCSGCSEHKPKRELIRIVKSPQGEISIDKTGRKQGRGAYICPSLDCLKKARKNKRVDRAFEVTISQEVYDLLEKELTDEG